MNQYNVALSANDPEITLQIPVDILRDIVLRSEENGTSIELELSLRLARSLERDLDMQEEDNQWASAAFNTVSNSNKLH